MKKILLLYFSGSGSTKMISEVLEIKLKSKNYQVDLIEITPSLNQKVIDNYDFFILGVPTYNGHPPKTVLNFIEKVQYQNNSKRVFLFATYGLYVVNNLRIVAKNLFKKNIRTVGNTGFRGPASDGVLLFPSWIKFMFIYEKNIKTKINLALKNIDLLFNNKTAKTKIPCYKWYAPLDWLPNTVIAHWAFYKFYKSNLTNNEKAYQKTNRTKNIF